MAGFMYFIPNLREAPAAQRLIELGLADGPHPHKGRVLPGHSNNGVADGRGPGGVGGWIVGEGGAAVPYHPAEQTWLQCEKWWIGCWNARRPSPADVVRPDALRGVLVQLGDGNGWEIPVARLQPMVMRFESGRWIQAPDPSHASTFAEADRIREEIWEPVNAAAQQYQLIRREVMESTDDIAPGLEDRFRAALSAAAELHRQISPDLAVQILSLNYRVGAEEISLLGLLRVDPQLGPLELFAIVDAFVDGTGIRAARAGKKN